MMNIKIPYKNIVKTTEKINKKILKLFCLTFFFIDRDGIVQEFQYTYIMETCITLTVCSIQRASVAQKVPDRTDTTIFRCQQAPTCYRRIMGSSG